MLTSRPSRLARGFSVVELLIAMTLGLVLISAAMSMLLATSRTNSAIDGISRLQEAGRFALFHMERDLRMAGYNGCAHVAQINQLLKPPAGSTQQTLLDFNLPIYGWREAAVRALPSAELPASFLTHYARGDVLLIKNAGAALGVQLSAAVEREAVNVGITPAIVPPFGQLLMLANCAGSADLFQVANKNISKVNALSRQYDEGLWPGNRNPASARFASRYRPDNSELTLAQIHLYYVGYKRGSDGTLSTETSLRRIRISLGAAMPDEELVAGVRDMRILYGVDPIHRGGIDAFYRADQIHTVDVPAWKDVVALRIGILAYSGDENDHNSADAVIPLAFDEELWDFPNVNLVRNPVTGVVLTPRRFVPPDTRIYRFFTSTVAARNRVH